jgi:Ca-activated chloride channel homolog
MNHSLRLRLVPLLALMNTVPLASQALSPPVVQPPRTIAVEAPKLAPLAEPRLSLRQGAEQAVRLGQVQIDLALTPGAAVTRIEMRFDNPNARSLEGDLEFPLAPGQTVLGFALDVDGQLRDAVPVDKPKAQAVFEAIERQRVDPGLLQMTEGNNYKLRVYPIPAQGSRTVVLRIGEALSSNAGQVAWRLPLMPRVAQGAYALHVTAHGFAQAPRVEGDLKLGFVQNGSSFVGHTTEQSSAARPTLLRATRDDGPRVLLGEREGRRYFHLDLPVPGVDLPRPRPRRIALVWDASGSGHERDTVRERALVAAYLRGLGDVSVTLYWLRDTLAAAGTVHIQAGDSSALDRQLAQVPYDGATALAGIASMTGVDEILLVSDGLANYDADALAAPQLPTHTIQSSPRANTRLLQRWADGSGGRYIDLTQLSADEAAQLLRTAPLRITGISSDGATDFASSRAVATDGRMDIAGVMTEAAATVTIELTDALGHKRSVSHRITAQATPSSLAPALWGERRVAALEGQAHLHRAAIRRIGQQVGLVTRDTSLLVLERVEDYVRFDIEPPAPLRAAYEARLSTVRREQSATRSQHLERVVGAFKARVAWWEQSFPKEPPIAVQISSAPRRAPMAATADAQRNEAFAPGQHAKDWPRPAQGVPTKPLACPTKTVPAFNSSPGHPTRLT